VSVQTLQEDLVKSRMKMQDLEKKRQFEDAEKEKDRMQRCVLMNLFFSYFIDFNFCLLF